MPGVFGIQQGPYGAGAKGGWWQGSRRVPGMWGGQGTIRELGDEEEGGSWLTHKRIPVLCAEGAGTASARHMAAIAIIHVKK